ncbi:GyrI-like domain-containing protein [Paenibacillus eucommiae]|uniref:Transcriptional regulator YdeE n=1 Tax=Paenibacillus eucommiae TaxID=1355755 RepID=A0ABS4IWN0_9BACL|nr:effector binding domain-containing protein [Paenibacillus eucommiae]MBP1991918.1 putative transcriptional regulator YdeE [Paenibacillus eucommiae]
MSEQDQKAGQASDVQIVQLEEMKFVGFPVVVSFKDGDFSKIGKMKQLFMERKGEIKHAVDQESYWSPWYSCELMFTYFYCLRVSELADIPEGMNGFTIPGTKYAAVSYEGPHPMGPDPYELLAQYRQANQIKQKDNGMVIEKYRFDQECLPNEYIALEVYGPIN